MKKQHKLHFLLKTLCKKRLFWEKNYSSKTCFFEKEINWISYFTLKNSKTEKRKNRKIKNNTSCIFCLKPYVKNGIFEKKIILVKHVFSKRKLIKFHILH